MFLQILVLILLLMLLVFLSTVQYPRKAETAFTGDLQSVKEGARVYLSSGEECSACYEQC